MEATYRYVLVTAVAPIAWGANYYVIRHLLPPGAPLWGAALRALPAGLLLLAVARLLPRASWWWRSAVLGVLNVGAFFLLIQLAAQLLPSSVASAVMATAPVALVGFGWALAGERPTARVLAGAGVGLAGVALVLLTSVGGIDGRGVLASASAMVMSSLGFVLAKRWGDDTPVLASTAWQLVAGGTVLLAVAVAAEGAPPAVDAAAVGGYAFVGLVATALAFVCWFTGLRHLSAGTVGIVGLLNPVTGVLLGTVLAAEPLTGWQAVGVLLVLLAVAVGRRRAPAADPAAADPARAVPASAVPAPASVRAVPVRAVPVPDPAIR